MTREEWVELSGDGELLFADGLDDAIIGVGSRCGQAAVVVYDVEKVYKAFQASGLSYDDAVEWAQFNTFGAWIGERTPMWVETSSLNRSEQPPEPAEAPSVGSAGSRTCL